VNYIAITQHKFRHKAISLLVASCFAIPHQAVAAEAGAETDCSGGNAKMIGTVVGGLLGAYIGNQLGDGKAGALVVGVALGGWLGNYIGSEIDRRHCELDKIAKANGIEIKTEELELKEDTSRSTQVDGDAPPESTENNAKTPISSGKIDIVRLPGAGHFASGSAVLTEEAKRYFADVAFQYSADKASDIAIQSRLNKAKQKQQLSETEKNKMREKLVEEFNRRPIVLVGHTDDTGDSKINQQLSEQRSRAVAAFFKSKGIPESRIYFRGAGDSDPVADNRTEEGREANRRVEIIELESVEKLDNFIALKKENVNYLRPKNSTLSQSALARNETTQTSSGDSSMLKKQGIIGHTAVSTKDGRATNGNGVSGNTELAGANNTAEIPKSEMPMPKSWVDFGGEPARGTVDSQLQSAMGKAIRPEKGVVASLGSWFVNEARAEDSKVYDLPCTADAPRYAGQYVSLQTGKVVEAKTKTSEYAPGLYQTTWVGVVNGNYLGLSPVGVLRDNFQPASHPDLFVYANTTAPGAKAKPSLRVTMQVNVYPGENGILYRIYSTGNTNLVCADLVLPRRAPFVAKAGKLYYKRPNGTFEVSYQPEMLSLNK